MRAEADRCGSSARAHGRAPGRWSAGVVAILAIVVAIATAGCGSDATSQNSGTVPVVTAEQVLTTCVQDYYANGILTRAAARTNCKACVVDKLAKLGIRPPAGQTVLDMLTGDRLSNSNVQTLQNACNESDANEQ